MPRRDWAPGERLLRLLIILFTPLKVWVRLEVHGLEQLEEPGAVLLVSNHDSSLDPLALIAAGMERRRPIRFLARASLWRYWGLPLILDGVRQIPIRRGAGDGDAMEAATEALLAGETVCIFPEGTISRGEELRARRGVSRLAQSAPGARIVLAAVTGGVELARFPRRPRVTVQLFAPAQARAVPAGDHAEFAASLLAEIRERVPVVAAGRRIARTRAFLLARWPGRRADGILQMRWSRAAAHRRTEQEPFDER